MPSYELLNVRSFGAVGDDSIDDSLSIQAAIDRANALGGGVVYCPPGTYRVSSQGSIGNGTSGSYCLDLKSNVTLMGSGRSSLIHAVTNQVGIVVSRGSSSASHVTDVRVASLRISGSDTGNGGPTEFGRAIFFWRTDRGVVENCEIDTTRLAFQSDRLSTDATSNRDIVFRNNKVHDAVGSSVGNGSGAFASGTDGLEISHNQLYNIPEHCLYIAQDVSNFRIIGNDCRSANGSPPGSGTPLGFGIQIFSGAATKRITEGLVSGNTIVGGNQGIYVQPQTNQVDILRLVILGNTITSTVLHGIHFIDVDHSAILGNTMRNAGSGGSGVSVELSSGIVINGNEAVGNAANGILVSNSTDCEVAGNVCIDNGGANGDGIVVGSAALRCRIVGNVCRGVQRYGINIGDAASTGCLVLGNQVSGNSTGPINNASNSPMRNNQRSAGGATQGRAVLAAGSATVATAEILAADNVHLTRVVAGGTLGHLSVGTITAGVSFVISSSNSGETSTVFWEVVH